MQPAKPKGSRWGNVLRLINLSIAILAIAILGAVYWWAWRPLPKTSGQLRLPISAPAKVVRDSLGVPHISAANWQDAIFLQGFVTAQDRLWQMDAIRRLAAGDLSEVIGPSTLQTDRDARQLRMRRLAEDDYRTLPPGDRALLAAYTRGVNAFIETHLHRLPLEFTLLRYDPQPWTEVDCILAGLQMYRNLTTSYPDELQKQSLMTGGDARRVDFLFPTRTGREFQPGSNAWALSGSHTASGKPLLANDPHLDFTLPATWYMIHLQAPGLNVTGVSLPGVPCVIIGHNERIAWGMTNLGFDVEDLYVEKLNLRTGAYLFRGKVEQARLEREIIRVRGARPVEFAQWVTRHGPVIVPEPGRSLALRWAAAEPGTFQLPLLDLDRASNWREFTAALERFPGPGQNFVYADVDGNIGYHAVGKLPIRPNYDSSIPVDGSSGQYEWSGFIPFDQLPASYNPPGGAIITSNQNPFPVDYKYPVAGSFAPPDRSLQVRSLLGRRNGWKPGDMLAVEKDVYSAFAHFLAQKTVKAYDRKKPPSPALASAIAVLRNWNGQMETGIAAPMLATLLYQRYRAQVAKIASPKRSANYQIQIAPAVVTKILLQNGQGWFKDDDGALLRCLSEAIEEGARLQGSDVKRWDYGRYNTLTIVQPIGSQLPIVGKYFNIGPVPMSGSSTTVKQITRRLGPSMRFIADLSDWDRSLNNITAGESEQILSRHYKDQWAAYYVGHSFPMQFHKVAAKSTLVVNPE